jgi:hypothetical protein
MPIAALIPNESVSTDETFLGGYNAVRMSAPAKYERNKWFQLFFVGNFRTMK